MNAFMEEALSDPHLAEISTLLLLGAVIGNGRTTSVPSNYMSVSMFDGLKKEMEEQVQKGLSLQLDLLRKVEEKCNVILVKVPVLESRTEEVASLKRQLEMEREDRLKNERGYRECVDVLSEEIVQLTLRIIQAEEGVEEIKRNLEAGMTPPATSSENKFGSKSKFNSGVVEIVSNLSKDIQSRLKKFADSQANLEEKIDRIKREVETNNFKEVVQLPVEVFMDPPPQPSSSVSPPPQANTNWSVGGVISLEPDRVGGEQKQSSQHERDSSKPCQSASLIDACGTGSFDKTLSETGAYLPPLSPHTRPTRASTRLRKKRSKEFPKTPLTTQIIPQGRSEPQPRPLPLPIPPNAIDNDKDCKDDAMADETKERTGVNCSSDIDILHGVSSTAGRFSRYLCLCGVEFHSNKDLLNHVGQQNDEKQHGDHPSLPLTCLCGKQFNSNETRNHHIKYFLIKKDRYACMPCGRGFESRCRLLAHMARNHPTANSQRSQRMERKQSFKKAQMYDQEDQRHAEMEGQSFVLDGKPRFGCRCGRTYAQRGDLVMHIRSATSGTEFNCHLCTKRYSLQARLKQHLRQVHNVSCWNKGKFACSSCATTFDNRARAYLHRHRLAVHPNS